MSRKIPQFFFPNFPLKLRFKPPPQAPVSEADKLEKSFKTKTIIVETYQNLTKIEIRSILERMYGFQVEKVNTLNVLHKRKNLRLPRYQRKMFEYKTKEFKRAYVILSTEVEIPWSPLNAPEIIKKYRN